MEIVVFTFLFALSLQEYFDDDYEACKKFKKKASICLMHAYFEDRK